MDNFKPGLISSNSEPKQKYFKEEEKPIIDLESAKHRNFIDSKMGYSNFDQGEPRLGWLVDISETIVEDPICPEGRSGIDLYFFQDDGSSFKATLLYDHYFYVLCTDGYENEVEEFLVKKYPKYITKSEIVEKDDLDLVIGLLTKANHLVGKKRKAVKISFCNFDHLKNVKSYLMQTAAQNRNRATDEEMYEGIFSNDADISEPFKSSANASEYIMELREHDLMYYTRVTIDQDIRVGLWYKVSLFQGTLTLEPRPDIVRRADPVVLAFDIETTKLPLKFPDSSFDSVMMISYMIDGVGFLITNREIVSQDIDDFEYTPKPEYQGLFHIFNEKNEKNAIQRFFNHIIAVKPTIFVTYNGDFFDWPFICNRAAFHGVDMYNVKITDIGNWI